ncbi:MAG: YggS family pyridoxal phosphate-dependent enzyme [Candidatus Omnitrophica bacterium]|nr:YggS family pyridoxal phosphate-dependent enzyme [Candidatus Omnitrophota bacterium]
MISENLAAVTKRITIAAKKVNRDPGSVKLVCVTKGRTIEQIKVAASLGVSDIGENRVQEAVEKYNNLKPDTSNLKPKWHLIGHLQTNKAKDAVRIFDLIHSVDSFKLAQEIHKQAAKINKVQDVLIEVNISGEPTKFGVAPEKLMVLAKDMISLYNIKLSGLMAIAPVVENPQAARPYFVKLRELKEEINNSLLKAYSLKLMTLSMGMSQDYEVAIEEGATMVRIGTAIFEGVTK